MRAAPQVARVIPKVGIEAVSTAIFGRIASNIGLVVAGAKVCNVLEAVVLVVVQHIVQHGVDVELQNRGVAVGLLECAGVRGVDAVEGGD